MDGVNMTDHDWQPIAPPEDNGIMCTVCFECKCCSNWTDECAGEWVPSEKDFNTRLWLDQEKEQG